MILSILIGKLILGYAIGAAVILVAAIVIAVIASLFDKWRQKNSVSPDHVGVLVNEGISNGSYKSIQGVFNKRTQKIEDAWRIQGDRIDPALKNEKVVIFD